MLYLDSNNCLFIHTLSKKPSELKRRSKGVVSWSKLLNFIDQSAHGQSFIAVANLIALTVSQKCVT